MDPLSDLLRTVRVSAAFFFHAELSEPWALAMPNVSHLLRTLAPTKGHAGMLHSIAVGSCRVDVGGRTCALCAGDLLVLPAGDAHTLWGGHEQPVQPVVRLTPGPLPWQEPPRPRGSGSGAPTRLTSALLQLDCDRNPLLAALPPLLVVSPDDSPTGALLQASVASLRAEIAADAPGAEHFRVQLSELVLVEIVRQHLMRRSLPEHGLLAALQDRGILRSLESIHAEPTHPWTIDELAQRAAMSRSGFAARFSRLLGQAPGHYLTRWRLQLASRRLRETDEPIAVIAERSGYGSEAAFSRAFKRELGQAPGHFRRESHLARQSLH